MPTNFLNGVVSASTGGAGTKAVEAQGGTSGTGVDASSTNGSAVKGASSGSSNATIWGVNSGSGISVRGQSSSGPGVYGDSASGPGVTANSSSGNGISASSNSAYAVSATSSTGNAAIFAITSATTKETVAVKQAPSQTADVIQEQNSSGTRVAGWKPGGELDMLKGSFSTQVDTPDYKKSGQSLFGSSFPGSPTDGMIVENSTWKAWFTYSTSDSKWHQMGIPSHTSNPTADTNIDRMVINRSDCGFNIYYSSEFSGPAAAWYRHGNGAHDNGTTAGKLDSGQYWLSTATPALTSNKFYFSTDANNDQAYVDLKISDFVAQWVINGADISGSSNFRYLDCMFCRLDSSNHLIARLGNGLIDLRKLAAGSGSSLSSTSITTNNSTNYTITVKKLGADLTIYVDSVSKVTQNLVAASSAYIDYTGIGHKLSKSGSPSGAATTATWDNFIVRQVF